MDPSTIISIVGTLWGIIWGIFTYISHKAKKVSSARSSVLASPDEVHRWHFEQEEKKLKHAILKSTFIGIVSFVISLPKEILIAILTMGSGGSTAGGSGSSEKAKERRHRKLSQYYEENFPENPDHTINFILGTLIVFTFFFLFGIIKTNQSLRIFIYGMGAGALITIVARAAKSMQRKGIFSSMAESIVKQLQRRKQNGKDVKTNLKSSQSEKSSGVNQGKGIRKAKISSKQSIQYRPKKLTESVDSVGPFLISEAPPINQLFMGNAETRIQAARTLAQVSGIDRQKAIKAFQQALDQESFDDVRNEISNALKLLGA